MVAKYCGDIKGKRLCYDFQPGLNVITGNSGTGKTYLYKIIRSINIGETDFAMIDWQNYTLLSLEEVLDRCNFIIFDNAELYMTEELLKKIFHSAENKVIVLTLRGLMKTRDRKFKEFLVKRDGKELVVIAK
ncbi:MAG: hypothetical protein IJ733_11230 [Lachnospiraceae bacterium]|nr:hypothetical protein [Lachnospiraceae bacterium]